ncbi:MAG TPA: GNAT family N-acetyltransferase [Sphingomonadaceae bacterium]|nr:GNAT family N-acetyltransferase [Sphingomonadaceae bacterium]
MAINIRAARPSDLPLIASLIRELAEYERLADQVRFDEAELGRNLFGDRPAAEVLIGELDGEPQGFALHFQNFSTFEGKPGLYLEDLFVRPAARGKGLGKGLILAVAAIAVQRDCARFEWAVLDWNEPAIAFYESLGARMMDDWRIMRLDGEGLRRTARSGA